MSLLVTTAVLVLIYFVTPRNPALAGLLAVIPIKIVATAYMSLEAGGTATLRQAIGGMLVGQWVWGFVLLGAYLLLK